MAESDYDFSGIEQKLGTPVNPDFSRLMDILDEIDSDSQYTDQGGFVACLDRLPVDLNTVAFAARKRADDAEERFSLDDGHEPTERERRIVLWLDAFIAGYRMCQQHNNVSVTQDGHHHHVPQAQDGPVLNRKQRRARK